MLQVFDGQPALGADSKGISRDRCTILVGPGGWRSKLETGGGSGGCVFGSVPGFSSLDDPLVFCCGDLFQPRERGFPRLGWHGSASSSSTSSDNGVYCLISASCGASRSLAEGMEPNSSLILWRCLEQFGFNCGVSLWCVGSLTSATTLSAHRQETRYPLHCTPADRKTMYCMIGFSPDIVYLIEAQVVQCFCPSSLITSRLTWFPDVGGGDLELRCG